MSNAIQTSYAGQITCHYFFHSFESQMTTIISVFLEAFYCIRYYGLLVQTINKKAFSLRYPLI